MAKALKLSTYLAQLQWYFYEKGLERVWNELAKFSNEEDAGNVAFTTNVYYGDALFATDMTAAYVPAIADPGQGRAGAGGTTYPNAPWPPQLQRFTALK